MFASLSRCSCFEGPIGFKELRKERGNTTTLVMQPDGHPGFQFGPRPIWLADYVGKPLQDHRASVFVLVQRRRPLTAASKCRSETWATSPSEIHKVPVRAGRIYLDGPYGAFHHRQSRRTARI